MKNRKQKQASAVARSRRFSVTMVTAAAILVAVAAITVVSKQLVSSKGSAPPVAKAAPNETGKKYVTVKVAGCPTDTVRLDGWPVMRGNWLPV